MSQVFDLLIVGGGITGSALLYVDQPLHRYRRHIGMLEKYAAPARVNSLHSNNSQTLHCGDIETNYSLEKALKVQRAARMVENYATAQPDIDHLIFRYPKMVLGVGRTGVRPAARALRDLSPHYPALRLLELQGHCPHRAGRGLLQGAPCADDEIVALGSEDEYTAVNFEALARSFVRQAQRVADKQ
jgi:malate dehydrogenase (quinone)